MSRLPPVADEDELDELPPLDGESGDSSEADDGVDSLDEDLDDPSLDDTTGEDDAADASEIDIDADERSWLDEPSDASDLELGDVALIQLKDEGFLQDEQEAALPDEETGFAETPNRLGLDGGDEGPLDEDEELRDEDLPALDADDEGEPADAGFVDARFAADEPLGLPWATVPWARVGAPLGLSGVTALVCWGRGALVGTREDSSGKPAAVISVDLEGGGRTLAAEGIETGDGADIQSLAAGVAESGVVAAVLRGGRLAVSIDGAAHFELCVPGVAVSDVAVTSGAVWLRTRTGQLLTFAPYGSRGEGVLDRHSLEGHVAAIAADGPHVTVLVVGSDRRATAVLRCAVGAPFVREAVEGPEVRASALLAARGRYLAYPGRSGVVRRGPDGVCQSFAWEGKVTALAFVDDEGTLLAATYSDADDATGIVRLDRTGVASIVARIGAIRGDKLPDGRVLGMACDDARGVVWVAGGFGVAAFAITPS